LPVHDVDFPDPFVLRTSDGYVAFATNAAGVNVQVARSVDLWTWQAGADALPVLPAWAEAGNTWAPTVLPRGDGYVLYVTVREPRSRRQAITVAWSERPEGPYRDTSREPLVFQEQQGGSIDPSPFVDDTGDGEAYLLWKCDANALNRRSSLWAQRLAGDGRSLVGRPYRLLEHDAAWERPLIEAPALVAHEGRYYLFYSANWWESDRYGIGYAVAGSVLGPYRKVTTRRPWFASDAGVSGPGGQEFVAGPDGRLRMAYHGWSPGRVGYPQGARSLRLVEVGFEDGVPVAR
jgi:beta-xylosidase